MTVDMVPIAAASVGKVLGIIVFSIFLAFLVWLRLKVQARDSAKWRERYRRASRDK